MSLDPARHTEKMKKKKAARDRMMAGKSGDKGLLIVHTGTGKGKSTAAFGMAIRCIGHGYPIGVIQFIKGAWDTAERKVLEGFGDRVTFKAMGEGFTWETQDRDRDIAAATRAWGEAEKLLTDPEVRLVILDELNVVLRYDYLSLEAIMETILSRPAEQHVAITGRGASDALIEAADLVTEMKLVKHPFRDGIKAQPGIEF